MAQQKKKREEGKSSLPSLKCEFNRVVSNPNKHGGRPFIVATVRDEENLFLRETEIEVANIINMFRKKSRDSTILKKYPELSKTDLDACRAWQIKCAPQTLPENFNIDENKKFFLMDENISYLLMYKVAKIFGWSSHVSAEGLTGEHNDDEKDIWAYAVAQRYKAVLTKDSDFLEISQKYRRSIIAQYGSIANCPTNTPVVIHVEGNVEPKRLAQLLRRYECEIRDFVEANDHRYAVLGRKGLIPMYHDSIPKRELGTANDNRPKPF